MLWNTKPLRKWKYHEENLVKMTSSSTPAPFSSSVAGWAEGTNKCPFDGDLTSFVYSGNPNATGHIRARLNFGQEIRIAEITTWFGYGGPVYDNYDEPEEGVSGGWGEGNHTFFGLYGIKADGTEVHLATQEKGDLWNANNAKGVITISSELQKIPFVALYIRRTNENAYQGWYRIWDCQITKYFGRK